MSSVFSTPDQLARICLILSRYIQLPVSTDTIPGAFLESVLAHVRGGRVLPTYDYIDVHQAEERTGWSIKSTRSATPVTWKRAKIANKEALIQASFQSDKGAQTLGDAILEFCNAHARASLHDYDLDEIGYARLIILPNGQVRYFERQLCSSERPDIFVPSDFTWRWSVQKVTSGKEQLRALHGVHKSTGKKWWAWHDLGENQLHFSGEKAWWPAEDDPHAIAFRFPAEHEKLSFDRLVDLLEAV
jgi:hypothetical protein